MERAKVWIKRCFIIGSIVFVLFVCAKSGMTWKRYIDECNVSAHGSLGNYKGDNAILKLNKVLANIEMLTKIEGHYPEDLLQSLANSQMVAEKELDMKGIGNVINHVYIMHHELEQHLQ